MYYKMCFKIGDKLKEKDIDTILSIIKEEAYDPSFLLDDKGYVAYGAEDNEKICMVASCKRRSLEFFIDHITDSLELRLDESGINEVSPFSFFSLVDRAERSQHMLYVGSSDAATKNLDGLSIEKIPMTNTYMSHDHFYVSYPISLEKEIERIEKDSKKRPCYKQNKSNYYLLSLSEERRTVMRKTLLKTLFDNNHLYSSYYGYVEITNKNNEDYPISLDIFKRTIEVIKGGVIVLSLEDEDIFNNRDDFDAFLDIMDSRNENLIIIESSYYDEKLVKAFTEESRNIPLRLIQDPGFTKEEAITILERERSIDSLKGDIDLLLKESGKNYFSYDDLSYIYNKASNTKGFLTKKSPMEKLSELPYMEKAKDLIESIISYSALLEERKLRGFKSNYCPALNIFQRPSNRILTDIPSLNMVFYGDRGTGKETVARLYSEILENEGIIVKNDSADNIQFVNRVHLMEKTPQKSIDTINKLFNRSRGGLVFIDWQGLSLDERTKDRECLILDNIINMMERHKGELVAILSLNNESYFDITKRNPGLLSSIPYSLHFSSYSNQELWDIFSYRLAKKGLKAEEGVKERVFEKLEEMRNKNNFSYGDTINSIITKGEVKLSKRITPESKDDELITLRPYDFD